ncbi:uncharacterized protein LOC134612296 [Pelobates fuscus]|uniref:uncharacterized protein LOC134612296 n=1 Tax=Pelobates fuscus TaxID=191477 RepID=UPI002FE4E9A2
MPQRCAVGISLNLRRFTSCDFLGFVLDTILGVTNEALIQAQYLTGNAGGAVTKLLLTGVSLVDGVLYCIYDFVNRATGEAYNIGSDTPPTPPSAGYWASFSFTEQTVTWITTTALKPKTISIDASAFSPLFPEPVSSLDLTLSVATGKCTILETGASVNLGIDVLGVCPIYGKVLAAAVNLDVAVSLSINKGIGLQLGAVSNVKISVTFTSDQCSCSDALPLIENMIELNVKTYLGLSAGCDIANVLPEPTPFSTPQFYGNRHDSYIPEVHYYSGYCGVEFPTY